MVKCVHPRTPGKQPIRCWLQDLAEAPASFHNRAPLAKREVQGPCHILNPFFKKNQFPTEQGDNLTISPGIALCQHYNRSISGPSTNMSLKPTQT